MEIKNFDTKKFVLCMIFLILLIAVVFNFSKVSLFVYLFLKALSPIFMGLVIAFILNLLMVKYEKLIFKKDIAKNKEITGLKRALSIFLTFLTLFLILTLIIMLLIPELLNSLKILVDNIGNYTIEIKRFGTKVLSENNVIENMFGEFMATWLTASKAIGKWFINVSPRIFTSAMGIFGSIFNFILGMIFSVYLLYNKENMLKSCKKVIYAYTSKKKANKIIEIYNKLINTFSKFVGGQLIEAVILGTLCTLGMLALRMPYAVLIGVVIGLTSLIPMLGAYIGAIPSTFLLLMEDPVLAILFVVFLIILQQIEGNVIYPKVVGSSIGLTGFWILFAVLVGGAIGGVLGILIGVPLCSVLYYLFKENVEKKLKHKKIKIS